MTDPRAPLRERLLKMTDQLERAQISSNPRSFLALVDQTIYLLREAADALREGTAPAAHVSAPEGYKCSDCQMGGEACPLCYAAWWRSRHPNVVQLPAAPLVTPEGAQEVVNQAERDEIAAELRQIAALYDNGPYLPQLRRYRMVMKAVALVGSPAAPTDDKS